MGLTTRLAAMPLCAVLASALVASVAVPALAQETAITAERKQYEVELGIGAAFSPKYEAADSYTVKPFPILAIGRFYLPVFGQVVDGEKKTGVFLFPSFGFQGERKASDDSDLTGTKTVDWALELGVGAGFQTDHFRAFAQVRQGINGHTGQVGELGFDGIFYPVDRVEVSVGPRASLGSDEYMDTYFGVTSAEAAASGGQLTAYNPSGGFKSVGLSSRVSYDWSDTTRLHLQAGYDRLIGDAADSPIVDAGSKDQFNVGLGVSYKFSFDLFR